MRNYITLSRKKNLKFNKKYAHHIDVSRYCACLSIFRHYSPQSTNLVRHDEPNSPLSRFTLNFLMVLMSLCFCTLIYPMLWLWCISVLWCFCRLFVCALSSPQRMNTIVKILTFFWVFCFTQDSILIGVLFFCMWMEKRDFLVNFGRSRKVDVFKVSAPSLYG